MRRMLTAMLLVLLVPVYALAAPETPYAPETVIHTTALSEEALALLDVLYPAALRGEESIALPRGTRYEDAVAAARSLSTDYPELFHLGGTWRIGYYQNSPQVANTVMPEYVLPMETYSAMLPELWERTGALTDMMRDGQADRAEALHDWLCGQTRYVGDEEIHKTAYGALVLGAAQCEGYSRALTLIYRLAGIPCGMVSGDTVDGDGNVDSHSWNVAEIDGVYTFIDATWNDQEDCVTHWYYGLTDNMLAADHAAYEEYLVPPCVSVAVNWHARRGLLASDRAGVLAALRVFAAEGEVSIRFTDAALYADFAANTNGWITEYNESSPAEARFYGDYRVYTGDAQRCVMLRAE